MLEICCGQSPLTTLESLIGVLGEVAATGQWLWREGFNFPPLADRLLNFAGHGRECCSLVLLLCATWLPPLHTIIPDCYDQHPTWRDKSFESINHRNYHRR
ncbi:hypothetical protein L209DRAFT_242244 [Thermothelomyces heterothallicus CBS 203.75]